MDFVQSAVFPTTKGSTAEFFLGFGIPFTTQSNIVAGTKKVYDGSLHAFYRVVGKESGGLLPTEDEVKINNFSVKASDRIHIYISFQRANNLFNFYFSNETTGETVACTKNYPANEYYCGEKIGWGVYHPIETGLSGFPSVTFKNCKAMTNISDTWTDLNNLEGLYDLKMIGIPPSKNILCMASEISNNNSFQCTWKNAT